MEQQAIVELLGKSALFGSLSEPDRGAIANGMRRVQFDPDQMIFSRGDRAREMYLVLEGKVRLSILTSDGRELSFAHAGPRNIFGEIATLDGGERTASATAISRVQAMALPQKTMLDFVEHRPRVAVAAIQFLCTRLRETDQLLEAIALHRIEVRIARLLLSALKLQAGGGAAGSRNVARRTRTSDWRQPAQGEHCPQPAPGDGSNQPRRPGSLLQHG
jgi:CRP-like cAMP-binding protein